MNDEHADVKKSLAAKYAWKKHGDSYRKGIRKRMRDDATRVDFKDKKERPMYANKIEDRVSNMFKDTNERLETVLEAKIDKQDIFDLEGQITMENIAGGIAVNVDSNNSEVSLSFTLKDTGESKGAYKLQNTLENNEAYEQLFKDILKDLEELAQSTDTEIKQILGKYGLMPMS